MQTFERITDILILVCILAVYFAVRQVLSLDAVLIGLVIIIYMQQHQIKRLKRAVSKDSSS